MYGLIRDGRSANESDTPLLRFLRTLVRSSEGGFHEQRRGVAVADTKNLTTLPTPTSLQSNSRYLYAFLGKGKGK